MRNRNIEIIQALRGFACILVVLCHTSYTHFGAYGVDFFLVISGFVIMYSTEKDVECFWKKRLIKIVPLYWFMTLMTAMFVYFLPSLFNSYEVSTEYIVKSMLFIPYEHSGIRQPLLGLGWTLNYEMLFYFVFWISMRINHSKRGLISIVICILLTVFSTLNGIGMPISFYSDGCLIEFCYGIIAYILYQKHKEKFPPRTQKSIAISLLASSILIVCSCLMFWAQNSGADRFLTSGVVAVFVLEFLLLFEKCIWVPKFLIIIGNASYCIYLLHIYPVRLLDNIAKKFSEPNLFSALFNVIFACVCGYVWFVFIEKKLQLFLKNKIVKNKYGK